MYDRIRCPYCDEMIEVDHDEGYEESTLFNSECSNCEKEFVYYIQISYDFHASKADCLNGEPHKYKPTWTAPKHLTRWMCEDCGATKELTDIEMGIFIHKGREGLMEEKQ